MHSLLAESVHAHLPELLQAFFRLPLRFFLRLNFLIGHQGVFQLGMARIVFLQSGAFGKDFRTLRFREFPGLRWIGQFDVQRIRLIAPAFEFTLEKCFRSDATINGIIFQFFRIALVIHSTAQVEPNRSDTGLGTNARRFFLPQSAVLIGDCAAISLGEPRDVDKFFPDRRLHA